MYHRGLHKRSPKEIEDDLVKDFPTSVRRAQLWESIAMFLAATAKAQAVDGDVVFDHELIELVSEPESAGIALFSEMRVTPRLHLLWKTRNSAEWNCETYLMPPKPADPESAQDWEDVRSALLAKLSDHDRKGLPVAKFSECHAHTKSLLKSTG